MAASSRSINQRHLADLLNLADARVRRLIQDYIAPASRDGGFKTVGAFVRDEFFVEPRPGIAFVPLVIPDRTRAIELMSAALAEQATLADVEAANRAVQTLADDLRYLTATREQSDNERELLLKHWQQQEDQALATLLARTVVLVASQQDPPENPAEFDTPP